MSTRRRDAQATEADPRRPLLHVPCPPAGAGLARDYRILLGEFARAGISWLDFPWPGHAPGSKRFRLKRLLTPALWKLPYAANLFLESIDPRWIPVGRVQMLMPNPEWLREDSCARLPDIDWVLCKTRHAEAIFSGFGCRTRLTGFTSVDMRALAGLCGGCPEPDHYAEPRPLHMAGKSLMKGTDTLLRVWSRHPEWPLLTVLARPAVLDSPRLPRPANVEFLTGYLDDRQVAQLMSSRNLHLCPSEAEGWGHSIVEAMACAAVVITTDAPPMNELVDAGRGLLVSCAAPLKLRAGERFGVMEDALEHVVGAALASSANERMQLGSAARHWYDANAARFSRSLRSALAECAGF